MKLTKAMSPAWFDWRVIAVGALTVPIGLTISATRLVGRVDFLWARHGVFGEMDGKLKYLTLRREGETLDEFLLRFPDYRVRRDDVVRLHSDTNRGFAKLPIML